MSLADIMSVLSLRLFIAYSGYAAAGFGGFDPANERQISQPLVSGYAFRLGVVPPQLVVRLPSGLPPLRTDLPNHR